MGTTQSHEKSSLLKNFQYMLHHDAGGNTKLLYFDYLNFLHYELQHKAWKWDTYTRHVNGGAGSGGGVTLSEDQQFCGWKQIQEQIFKTLQQHITGKNKYTWKDDVEPLINIEEKKHFTNSPPNCSKIKIETKDIPELNNAVFPDQSKSQQRNCGLKTSKDIHIPLRRRGLLVSYIYKYLKEVENDFTKETTDQSHIENILKKNINIKEGSTDTNFNLTKDLVEGIAKEISKLIKDKHKNDDTAFCKEWERTMDDYFKLLQGIDIVDDKETNELQCLIQTIEGKVGNKNAFKRAWTTHFRNIVTKLKNNDFTNEITKKPCPVDRSEKSQCVRFFEEWAEEFCALKRNLGNMVVEECGKTPQGNNCKGLCNMYEKFMNESKPYFTTYMNTCADERYGNTGQNKKELENSFIQAAMNSMTECCTGKEHCNQTELFQLNEDKSNIRYKCFCPDGQYNSKRDSQPECKNLLNPSGSGTLQGQIVAPQPPVTASQTTTSVSTTPNCDADNTKCGYKDFIETSGYNKIKGQQNCCGLKNAAENANSKRKIKWRNKNDEGCDYLTRDPFKKDPIPEEVYLPPRKQNLCFQGLDGTMSGTDVKDEQSLKKHLMKVSVTEGYNLGEYYKEKNKSGDDTKYNYDVSPCSALKYSFLDLRDIILGYDMVEHDSTGTGGKLSGIFKNGSQTKSAEAGKPGSTKRREFWNDHKSCVWNAMLCGYKRGRDGNGGTANSVTDLQNCNTMPDDTTYPIGIDRDSGTKFQFLRWTIEWSEDFCNKRKKLADKVVKACGECKNASDDYHSKNTIGSTSSGSSTNYSGTEKHECSNGASGGKSDPDCGDCKTKCDDCKEACQKYKEFVEGKSGQSGNNNWRHQWNNMETKYTKLMDDAREKIKEYHEKQQEERRKVGSTGGSNDSTPPYMEKCGTDELCIKSDIDSFFQNLHDKGISTLSSYINSVTTTCGEDNAKWGRNTVVQEASGATVTSGQSSSTTMYPQPFGDNPTGFKYACECRIPSREELCGDSDMYRNRWDCNSGGTTATGATGVSRKRRAASGTPTNYELCKDKSNNTDATREAQAGELQGAKLDEKDVVFFNLFDSWYKDIQNMLDQNIKRIMDECNQDKIMKKPGASGATISGNTRSPLCQSCRDSCECYKLWVSGITEQWRKQQNNFKHFETKQPSGASGKVTMNDFLFSSCWEDYIEEQSKRGKTINISELNVSGDDGDMIDVLMDRCGDTPSGAQTKFDDRIKKAEKKKTMCDRNQDRCKDSGKPLECGKVGKDGGNVNNCHAKKYDDIKKNNANEREKNWDCTGKDKYKDVCMSPRTQQLCVANMYTSKKIQEKAFKSQETIKTHIEAAMKKETENLYQYYNLTEEGKGPIISKTPDGTKGDTDKNGMPQNFCLAAQRTYNDFKHMVLGDSISKHKAIHDIGEEIKKVLDKSGGGGKSPHDWWEQNSDKFWDAIKCGIKEATSKNTATSGSKNFSGNECGRYPPDNTDDQFVWWFKEWGQEFCVERNKHMKGINATCSGGSSSSRCPNNGNQLTGDCKNKCDKYKDFIKEKQSEWDKQKKKYEREHPGDDVSQLFGEFPECLETNFETIFENSGNTAASVKPGNSGSNTTYFDASDICSCEQQTYKSDGRHPSTCKDKSNDTAWRSGSVKIGTNGQPLRGVFAPPRRQKLCLANLHPINFGKPDTRTTSTDNKKNDIFNRLKIVAEREAFYLWKQHVPQDNKDDEKYHKKACCAIRRSFFDIGDIVKGIDLWDDAYTQYFDGIISGVFKEDLEEKNKNKSTGGTNNPIDPDKIKQERKNWWDSKKNDVWDAMQNGVTNALNDKNKNGKTYKDIKCMKDDNGIRNFVLFATPQFMRWFKEWTNQFCEEYKEHIGEVEQKCKSTSGNNNQCNDGANSGCKEACTKYTNWINSKRKEWLGMKNYYNRIMSTGKSSTESPDGTDYSDVMIPTAIGYLNTRCNQAIDGKRNCCFCDKVGTTSQTNGKPLEHMDLVVALKDQRYSKYRGQCTDCQLKHIKDQIGKIEEKVKERETEKKKTQVASKPQAKSQVATGTSGDSTGVGKAPVTKPGSDSTSGTGGEAAKPVAAKPAAAKPVAAKPASGGPDASGSGNVKPEVPRPQSSEPQGPVGHDTSGKPQGPPPQGDSNSRSSKDGHGAAAPQHQPTTPIRRDQEDGGLIPGNGVTKIVEHGSTGSTAISVATVAGPAAQATPAPDNTAVVDASSSSSGGSGGGGSDPTTGGGGSQGGGAGGPSSQGPQVDGGKVAAEPVAPTTQTKPADLGELWKTIRDTASLAGGLGVLGTSAVISAVKDNISEALQVAKGAAEIAGGAAIMGLGAGIHVGKSLYEKINADTSQARVDGTHQGSNTAPGPANGAASPVQPGNSGNSGTGPSSGTGSTGNQDTSGQVASGSSTHTASQPPGGGGPGGGGSGGTLPGPISSPGAQGQVTPQGSPQGQGSHVTGSQTPSHSDLTSDILTSTISPVGISIALGSIALLYYLKKKTTAKSPDLFRVLEIPQKDSGMPRYRSANSGYQCSSDVTSSDSEVDEVDINEIYGYGGGKHKTLIDIILRPSTSGTTPNSGTTQPSGNTTYSGTIPSGDTINSGNTQNSGTDSIVDNPYSDNIYSDTIYSDTTIPSDTTTTYSDTTPPSDNTIYSDTHFIIQIQDRQLGGNNTHIYDVGGVYSGISSGTPGTSGTNIYTTTHNMDIPKYVSPHTYMSPHTYISPHTHNMDNTTYTTTYVSPHIYSGTDLINDSLYSDRHIDIYEEMLKRKEKELYSGGNTT
ncbi:erythrocyte membrane protein 1, PfEMP1, putative [Plasmodium gaboni]|uniref:Erythrocyte membrane protein 1, PfEMP1, putative n=1 Tax=Plasmodium gaboni TaxID=647221 RepID=A0ABY0KWB9_9APIC|nr:erythrocyte membrane protein 1, PfEMP1, putative [Plasmodium gaboni]